MIFQHTFDQVISRRKTVTRRRMYPGDLLTDYRGRLAVVQVNGFPRWIVGKDYAIHRRRGVPAEPGVRAKVTGLGLDFSPLEIDDAEAALEGFASVSEFVAAWQKLHRHYAQDPCWRIAFELIESGVAA